MILENRKYIKYGWLGLIVFFFGVILSALIIQLKSNCFHATDFTIYQEAIFKMAHFGDLNPFVYVRNINIFNDHFDPIILLAAGFVKVFGLHAVNLIIFEFLWLLGIVLIIGKSKSLTHFEKLYFATLVLFTKGILSGLNFPIHPTTWSMLPCFLLPFALKRNKPIEIIFLGFSICLFKESFPFAVLMLGLYYSIKKEFKTGFPLLLIAISFLIFNFHFRSLVLGPTISYGGGLLKPLFENPIDYLIRVFTQLNYKSFFKAYYPFIIPIFFLIKSLKSIKKVFQNDSITGTIFFYAPLFAIQFLANNVHHQYGAQLTAPILGVMVINKDLFFQNKRLTGLIIVLFILSGMGSITKAFRATFSPKQRFCVISDKKSELNSELKTTLASQPKNLDVLATGGVIPMLYSPERTFYQAGYFSERKNQHGFLILERNGSGKTFPLTQGFIEKVIPLCRENSSEILIDNEYFFMVKEPGIKCLKKIHAKWVAF